MKKIVTIPIFCESHLVKYQIPNIIDTIDPDYIIYNEGLFPNATEGQKNLTQEWLDKYGWESIDEVVELIEDQYTSEADIKSALKSTWPDVEWSF